MRSTEPMSGSLSSRVKRSRISSVRCHCTSTASTSMRWCHPGRHVCGRRPATERRCDPQRERHPHINHPNFRWSITREELEQVRNNRLLEIFNGHPQVNNEGGGGVPGLEEVWDALLTNGTLLYGIAVDDAHRFKQPGNPDVAGPGRGWVAVRAARLEARAVLEALERGDFYASTGVELADYQVTPQRITVSVEATTFSKYRIQFIGKGGRVLREVVEPTATYEIRGDEGTSERAYWKATGAWRGVSRSW